MHSRADWDPVHEQADKALSLALHNHPHPVGLVQAVRRRRMAAGAGGRTCSVRLGAFQPYGEVPRVRGAVLMRTSRQPPQES